MRVFVPEERVITSAPEWWKSERYDFCDMDAEKDNKVKKFFKKITNLFA